MAINITLPLSEKWTVEKDAVIEDGEEVFTYYAYPTDEDDPELSGASIELYVGNTPEESDAKIECINNYLETIGLDEGEEDVPVKDIPFLGVTGWYYDAQDDEGQPVILICAEPSQGVLVMAILAHRDEESLDELISYVDENLTV